MGCGSLACSVAEGAAGIVRSVHRFMRVLAVALITAGITIAVDVGLTLAWKEPVSTIYGSIQQGKAEDSLAEVEREFLALPEVESIGNDAEQTTKARARELAGLFAEQVKAGEGIGRIEIPSIDVGIVFVEGTDTSSLRKGPGRYPDTAFPGQGRTIGIAGHRTTYLAPFHDINEIKEGDEITLEMPYATFSYTVEGHEVVEPTEVEIVDDVGYERLVLTACHPLFSAAQRWAVFARLSAISAPGE
jgi:sortase A